MTTKEYVLVVTVGKQDLKCWTRERDEGKVKLLPFPPDDLIRDDSVQGSRDRRDKRGERRGSPIRGFHSAILADEITPDVNRARIVTDIEGVRERCGGQQWRDAFISINEKRKNAIPEQFGFKALQDAEGRLLLYPAKVAPLLAALEDNKAAVRGVLVVHTNRVGDPSEPIASGPWVQQHIAERFGLTERNCFLENAFPVGDRGRIEGAADSPIDFPVRREVVYKLGMSIRKFADHFGPSVIPLTLMTGGIAPLKEIVRAEVDLAFDHPAIDLSMAEGHGGPKGQEARQKWAEVVGTILQGDVISRVDAINARARALDLARRGDFPGSWAAVRRQSHSAYDQAWLQPLHMIARYFGGGSVGQENVCIEDGDQGIFEQLAELDLLQENALKKYRRFALNAAFRMEAALQGDEDHDLRLVDALASLCTLIDTLVMTKGALLIHGGRFKELSIDTATGKVTGQLDKYPGIVDKKRKKVSNLVSAWKQYLNVLGDEREKSATDQIVNPIVALEDALYFPPSGKRKQADPNLRQLRNMAMHEALSEEQIGEIKEVARKHDIWQLSGSGLVGKRALFKGGLIDNALVNIGEIGAGERYRQLIEESLMKLLRGGPIDVSEKTRR